MANLYLIQRGKRPDGHRATYHQVIICDRKRCAAAEWGWTGDGATVWVKEGTTYNRYGWLLIRWKGLLIDYGHVVRSCHLPDGGRAGFWRDYETTSGPSLQELFPGAVWWSNRRAPEWLLKRGVIYPPDDFTQQWILDEVANDGASGAGRKIPPYWPQDASHSVRTGAAAAAASAFVAEVEATGRQTSENLIVTQHEKSHVAEIRSTHDDPKT